MLNLLLVKRLVITMVNKVLRHQYISQSPTKKQQLVVVLKDSQIFYEFAGDFKSPLGNLALTTVQRIL